MDAKLETGLAEACAFIGFFNAPTFNPALSAVGTLTLQARKLVLGEELLGWGSVSLDPRLTFNNTVSAPPSVGY